MGVDFKDLVPKTPVKLEDLSGKIIAIDAYNAIYQFLSIIRQPDGTPLKDSSGKITSHLSGLFYRTSNLVEMGLKPIYVFDGIPPTLKAAEIERRRQVKVQAVASYEKAAAKGDTEKMRMFAQAATSMKDYMQEDSRRLLELMGLPWISAPSEGEAQAAYMTRKAMRITVQAKTMTVCFLELQKCFGTSRFPAGENAATSTLKLCLK